MQRSTDGQFGELEVEHPHDIDHEELDAMLREVLGNKAVHTMNYLHRFSPKRFKKN